MARLQADPALDAVYADCMEVDTTGRPMRRLRASVFSLRTLLEQRLSIPQPTVFLRRRLFERIGPLDERLHLAMDYDLWLRAALAGGRFLRVPEVWANARVHALAKMSTRATELLGDHLSTYEKVFNSPALPAGLARLQPRVLAHAHLRGAERSLAAGDWAEARRRLSRSLRLYWWPSQPWVFKTAVLACGLWFQGPVPGPAFHRALRLLRVGGRSG
jgi:hypothetical protein